MNTRDELEERYEEIGENLLEDPETLDALAEAGRHRDVEGGLEIIASRGLQFDPGHLDPTGILFIISTALMIKQHGMQWKMMGKGLAKAYAAKTATAATLSYLSAIWPAAMACTIS
jgi:hypothetical protein